MKPTNFYTRAFGRAAVFALTASLVLVSAPSFASPTATNDAEVTHAELTWGFKETFRSYISGNIAKGGWEVSDGATYETPEFRWNQAQGELNLANGSGTVKFSGVVEFSGHDGQLSTLLENPTLEFVDSQTAYLLLDVTGVSMADALSGNESEAETFERVRFVELDLSSDAVTIDPVAGTIQGTDVPTVITDDGFDAFPNYEVGTIFDPISFSVQVDASAPSEQSAAATDDPASESSEAEQSSTDQTPGSAEAASVENATTAEPSDSGISPAVIVAVIAGLIAVSMAIFQGVRRSKATPK